MLAHCRSWSAVWHRQMRLRSITTTSIPSLSSSPAFALDKPLHSDHLNVIPEQNVIHPQESGDQDTNSASLIKPMRKQQYSLFVRSWGDLLSIHQIFAIVRAIERRYGRVRGISVQRVGPRTHHMIFITAQYIATYKDEAAPQIYLSYCVVDLADRVAWERVPEDGAHIRIEKPEYNVTQPGGPGLSDLAPFLEPTTLQGDLNSSHSQDEALPSDKEEDMLDVKIERSSQCYSSGPRFTHNLI